MSMGWPDQKPLNRLPNLFIRYDGDGHERLHHPGHGMEAVDIGIRGLHDLEQFLLLGCFYSAMLADSFTKMIPPSVI